MKVDSDKAVDLVLAPGQMSLHDVKLVHGSEPNPSPRRRIGLAIRYMPTHVRQDGPHQDHVWLVRGVDAFNNFPHAPHPQSDLAPEAIAFHQSAMRKVER